MNVEDLYRLLRTGHVQAQGIVDTVSDPMLVLDESLRVLSASRSFFETFKVDRYETIGQLIYELGNGQWDIPELRLLLSQVVPRSTAVVNFEVEHDFPNVGRRTMLLTARTLFHPDNAGHSMLLSMVDATDRHRRDLAKDLLFGELRHRMKNLLGVAQSLARQTSTEGRSAEQYRDTFLGRFRALVEAQDLAFAEQDEMGLAVLMERILAPFTADPKAVVIEPGASVVLGPDHDVTQPGLSRAGHKRRQIWRSVDAGWPGTGHLAARGSWPAASAQLGGERRATRRRARSHGLRHSAHPVRCDLYSGRQLEQRYDADGLRAEMVIPLGTAPLPG